MIHKKWNFLNEKNIKIRKRKHAFKDYGSIYNVKILNYFNTELQLTDTESAINNRLIELLTQLKGFNFVKTLVLLFTKTEIEEKTKYDNFYSSSKPEIIINESDIDDVFKSIYRTIKSNINKFLQKGSAWIIHFKDLVWKVRIKIRDIHKIEKKNSTGVSTFGYKTKWNNKSLYQKLLWI